MGLFYFIEPGPIDPPILLDVKSRMMLVTWQHPLKCNGVLTHYNIYQHGDLYLKTSGNMTNCTVIDQLFSTENLAQHIAPTRGLISSFFSDLCENSPWANVASSFFWTYKGRGLEKTFSQYEDSRCLNIKKKCILLFITSWLCGL